MDIKSDVLAIIDDLFMEDVSDMKICSMRVCLIAWELSN